MKKALTSLGLTALIGAAASLSGCNEPQNNTNERIPYSGNNFTNGSLVLVRGTNHQDYFIPVKTIKKIPYPEKYINKR